MIRQFCAILGLLGSSLQPVSGQDTASKPPIPQIIVTGRGETKITPDRAMIRISVQSREPTASADADAAAGAAGGTLGGLIEMDVGSYSPPGPRPVMMARAMVAGAQDETPISPGEETLSIEVTARWRFIGGN